MALEDIQKKIIADAEKKKTDLIAAAEQQCAEILEQAKKTAQEYQVDHNKNALSNAENLERGLVIDARRKLSHEILTKKRERIEQTFLKAKAEFIASSDYSEIMSSLVTKSLVSKKEQIILGQNETKLNQQWLDSVNQKASASLSFASEKGNFQGGIILAEGDTFVNITVDSLFALLREESEKPVADILFKG